MIGIVGDAELDEGNVYECLLESMKLGIRHAHPAPRIPRHPPSHSGEPSHGPLGRNAWWIVDYNRQSLDKALPEEHFRCGLPPPDRSYPGAQP